ncbi:hypothetical protein ma108 [Moumouvirus australiensis]|uniref:Uncharacterized protein n=1 Tax=Moumouvirus australiensis TaxID=2109587 RepID=A0A2P1EKU8_9VIRU|nr:hypothetical protein QKC55_gp796 [Moumouvirus australiensis]AVL94494.1 hypothetical protein ma108 [Moumouvirus australiensis]
MEKLDPIFKIIFENRGMLSGSFVRDCIIREQEINPDKDIDVLVPFDQVIHLKDDLVKYFGAEIHVIDFNEEDKIYHFIAQINDYEFDIFSGGEICCYLSPPDVDVNTLCWDSFGLEPWYYFCNEDEKKYGHKMRVDDIIQRCMNKQAVVIRSEWENENDLSIRLDKLIKNDWTLLN